MADARARVVVAGSSGLIGSALVASLRADAVPVVRLVRRPPAAPDEIQWDPQRTRLAPEVLAGARAVVGLNGADIGRFPWTRRYRHELLWSRLAPTQAIAAAVRALGEDGPAFVSASATGFYPSERGAVLTEASPGGTGFLADVCRQWEAAAQGAGQRARVAMARTAPVVDPDGVLRPLLLLTRFGLSGPICRGTQVWPWISLTDEVRALRHVIDSELDGPVNLTGPTRATANDLGFALARTMNRPFLVRAPEWGLRLALGADATESLLTGDTHVVPERLTSTGFAFTHPTVEAAVRAALRA